MAVIDNLEKGRLLAKAIQELFPGTFFADKLGYLTEEAELNFHHGFSLVESATNCIVFQVTLEFTARGELQPAVAYLSRTYHEVAEKLHKLLNDKVEESDLVLVNLPSEGIKAMRPHTGSSQKALWLYS